MHEQTDAPRSPSGAIAPDALRGWLGRRRAAGDFAGGGPQQGGP